ncbi:hypothetical protein MLD38_038548 [Melastoma candidum]|uniref:Uncharacterized protein n=1 Tax=Melastoma candidum TaxID=119954 RepID=A0ACB9L0I2_9MYRT|nr:hypothetical protein MLD38_038548 [Melastoma candidum]
MARLRTAMDAHFWDLNVATPLSLVDASAKLVPGDTPPADAAVASRVLRVQQLSFLRNGIPFGIVPSWAPNFGEGSCSFSLQSLLLRPDFSNWWLGLVGQFQPGKLIKSIKKEISNVEEWDLWAVRDVGKHMLDKSLYSVGLILQLALSPSTSIAVSTEKDGDKANSRKKLMLFSKVPNHDIFMEAAWPGLFIDGKGRYWDVPESLSLDFLSHATDDGFRYRFGIHKNGGHPQAVNATEGEVPSTLMPGLCAMAAFSYEKSRDFWRQEETREDVVIETEKGLFWRPAYDVRLKEPHASVSGIIGGACTAWFWNGNGPFAGEAREMANVSVPTRKRRPFSGDLFCSICYTIQHGKFRKYHNDMTRFDARVDVSSASALARRVFNFLRRASTDSSTLASSSPRLSLIFQQQVVGPIVFRMDSRFVLDPSLGKQQFLVEDFVCSLSYSLRLLNSGKVVAWYSPKRKEGMIELRLFEF